MGEKDFYTAGAVAGIVQLPLEECKFSQCMDCGAWRGTFYHRGGIVEKYVIHHPKCKACARTNFYTEDLKKFAAVHGLIFQTKNEKEKTKEVVTMKVFRFTLFKAVYTPSVSDSTKSEITSFEARETFDVVAGDLPQAPMSLDVEGYMKKNAITNRALVHVAQEVLELKSL